jgi:hypothetical protein
MNQARRVDKNSFICIASFRRFLCVYPKANYTGKVRETFAPWGFTVRGVNEEAKPAEAVKNAQVSVRLPQIFSQFFCRSY